MKDHDHQCDLAKFGLTELDPNEDGSWLNEAGIAMFQACADFLNGLLAGRAWVCLPEHIASWIVALVANKYAHSVDTCDDIAERAKDILRLSQRKHMEPEGETTCH